MGEDISEPKSLCMEHVLFYRQEHVLGHLAGCEAITSTTIIMELVANGCLGGRERYMLRPCMSSTARLKGQSLRNLLPMVVWGVVNATC